MHQSIAISLASTALLAATAASAKTLRIDVGKGGLAFAPNSVTASKGDVVEFHFGESTTHNVVAGDFESPCQPASSGGFYSGAMAGGSGMLWVRMLLDLFSRVPQSLEKGSWANSGMNGVCSHRYSPSR